MQEAASQASPFITYFLSGTGNFNYLFHSNLTLIPEEGGRNPILQKGNVEPRNKRSQIKVMGLSGIHSLNGSRPDFGPMLTHKN